MCDVVITGKTNGMSVCVFLYFLKHSKVDSFRAKLCTVPKNNSVFFFGTSTGLVLRIFSSTS